MRRLLLVAAVLVFLAGLQLYLFPLRTADWFAWTIDVPMTAVFLGAAYWSSAVLEIAGARSATWDRARLGVWTVLVFTTLTLVVTLVHLDKFHLGAEHPGSARSVTVGWLAVYLVVPVVMVALIWLQSRHGGATAARVERERPHPVLRWLLVLLAVVLLGLGVALLLFPLDAARLWPWPLTELTGRAVGAWLVGLGWAAAHARLIDRLPSIRPLGLTGATFVLFQAIALLRHGDALTWSSPTAAGYVAGLAVIALVSGWILAASGRRPT
ncbi:hypothetical protein [Nocardioides sp.]|uniref:hypothetical protein n=1 Tax=Nocardioides sp. TaxID=35761 RepID=UPI002ED1D803